MTSGLSPELFPFLSGLDVPPAWEQAAGRFVQTEGLTLVLGGTDTGKSTLCRYLVYRAYLAGHRVALIDCDLGQSHLGPPATLGLDLYPPGLPGDDCLIPANLYFIGQTSPVGQVLEVVVGTRWLADQAGHHQVSRVVVNTSGFIQGPGALRLKWAQIELLAPRLILALEQEQELHPLLIPLARQQPATLIRLPLSPRAAPKSPEFRRRYREERFQRYFRGSRRYVFPLNRLAWRGLPLGQGEALAVNRLQSLGEYLGTPVLYGETSPYLAVLILTDQGDIPNLSGLADRLGVKNILWLTAPTIEMRLVGLLDENFILLALGLILPSAWENQEVTIWSPLPPNQQQRVRHCRVGRLRLNLQGRELNRV